MGIENPPIPVLTCKVIQPQTLSHLTSALSSYFVSLTMNHYRTWKSLNCIMKVQIALLGCIQLKI